MSDFTAIPSHEVVQFSIEVDGARVICWISFEALTDHFGGGNLEGMVASLLRNMNRIAPVAEKAWRANPGERVLLRSRHF